MKQMTKYLENPATQVGSLELGGSLGSVVVGINTIDLDSNPSDQLEQSLVKVKTKLDKKSMDEIKSSKANFYLQRTGYKKQMYGSVEENRDKFIFIASEPVGFNYMKMYDFKITFHQSQFKNQRDLAETFVKIFGWKNAEAILLKGKILRFDAWIDTEIPYDTLKKFVYRPKVTVSEQQKSKMRTFYLGSKKPKQAVIYEKDALKVRKLDVKKKGKS